MKVTLNTARVSRNDYTSQRLSPKSIANPQKFTPQLITFAGGAQDQILFLAAEAKPYFSVGGVATVVDDYMGPHVFPNHKKILVIPYYNGRRLYNADGGMLKEVEPLRADGKIWLSSADLKSKKLADAKVGKEKWELEQIAAKRMEWADGTEDIRLFKVKGKDHYVVYSPDTARMAKPYEDGSYATGALRQAGDGGEAYAKFTKAFAEFKPELENIGVNPRHILLNDPQTGYLPEYISRRIQANLPVFQDAKMSFVQHNLGPGYQGGSCFKNMFFNFATPQQVRAVMKDMEYFSALKNGREEEYFAEFFKKISDEEKKTLPKGVRRLIQNTEGQPVISMIPIRYTLTDNLTAITPVSEMYADSAVANPKVALGLTPFLQRLQESGRYRGILNGLNSPGINPIKVSGLEYYKEPVDFKEKIMVDGVEQEVVRAHFEPFETYNPDWFVDLKSEGSLVEKLEALKQNPENLSKIDDAVGELGKLKEANNGALNRINELKQLREENNILTAKINELKEQAAKVPAENTTLKEQLAANISSEEAKLKENFTICQEMNVDVWEQLETAKQKRLAALEEKFAALKNNPKDIAKIDDAIASVKGLNIEVMETIEMVKQRNMHNLFRRMQEGIPPEFSIGKKVAGTDLIGRIAPEWVEKTKAYIESGGKTDKITLLISWGRADEQKGLDLVLNAYKKFRYNSDGSINPLSNNTVLILGGQMDGKSIATETKIKMILESIKADPNLNGRVVFMNGFAPNSILAGAGDSPLFPSRFAPCELTDFEAQKYGASPIVTGLQGLEQKNFDPREGRPEAERARATGYKTKANSFMEDSEVMTRDPEFKQIVEKETQKIKDEFKLASVKNSDGTIGSYSDEQIEKFVQERLKKSQVIEEAYRKATDKLIVDDLSVAMGERVSASKELKTRIMFNDMKVRCGWGENHSLHGTDATKSSTQLYAEFHLGKPAESFKTTLFDYSFMPEIKDTNAGSAPKTKNVFNSRFDTLSNSNKFFNKKVLAITAGVILVGSLGYHFFKNKIPNKKHASSYIA